MRKGGDAPFTRCPKERRNATLILFQFIHPDNPKRAFNRREIFQTILFPMDSFSRFAGFFPLGIAVERYLEAPDRSFAVKRALYHPAALHCGCEHLTLAAQRHLPRAH